METILEWLISSWNDFNFLILFEIKKKHHFFVLSVTSKLLVVNCFERKVVSVKVKTVLMNKMMFVWLFFKAFCQQGFGDLFVLKADDIFCFFMRKSWLEGEKALKTLSIWSLWSRSLWWIKMCLWWEDNDEPLWWSGAQTCVLIYPKALLKSSYTHVQNIYSQEGNWATKAFSSWGIQVVVFLLSRFLLSFQVC